MAFVHFDKLDLVTSGIRKLYLHSQGLCRLENRESAVGGGTFDTWDVQELGGFKMPVEPEGWHMDAGPPSWDAEAKTFSFFLRKPGHERVLCTLALEALEQAVQSSDLSWPSLTRIFDAHRQMIELRAAQKLNAGLLDPEGCVLVGAEDI